MTARPLRAALLAAVLLPAAPRAADAPDPLAPFGWLAELAGACWAGTYPDGKTSDTQCYEVQWGRFLRGSISLTGVHAGRAGSAFLGDSVFAWSPRKERIVYTNWSSDGGYGTGEALLEGGAILFPDPPREGKPEARSRWTRIDRDAFEVVRERREGSGWTELLTVVYRRAQRR